MADENLKDSIWQGVWDTERLSRYYYLLTEHLHHKDRKMQLLVVVFAALPTLAFLNQVPAWIIPIPLALIAALRTWTSHANYAGKAAMADLFGEQYRDLNDEWLLLMRWGGKPDAVTALRQRERNITRGRTVLGTNYNLTKKAECEAREVMAGYHYPREGGGDPGGAPP